MKSPNALLLALWLAPAALPAQEAPPPGGPGRLTLSVREADLRDILRAATEGTNINLSFEPGLDTKVRGLDLKAVTLEELLDGILPGQGLAYTRHGRTIHVHRGDGGLRFYQIDQLAMRRAGTKFFQVNASGQIIQSTGGGGGQGSSGGGGGGGGQGGGGGGGGGGGQGGNSSAYTSSLQSGNAYDPWQELEMGLATLIFGEPVEFKGGLPGATGGGQGPGAPTSKGLAKEGKSLIIQPDSGLVVVGADPGTQSRVAAYLRQVATRSQRQVLLEARIVEVTLGKDSQVGVDWNSLLSSSSVPLNQGGPATSWGFTPGDTLNPNVGPGDGLFRLITRTNRVTAALSALARDGKLQVLSAPRISALNNQKAILRVVREEAFFLQNSQVTPGGATGGAIATVQITPVVVPVGIVLDIQPQIGADGTITLAVNPSVSEIVTVRSFSVGGGSSGGGASASLPVVDRRDLDTVVRMRSGETLVLAGIIKTKEGADDRGVPWIQRIPFVGQLFKKQERTKLHTELAIFITPTLVDDSGQQQEVRKSTEERLEKAGAVLGAKNP